MSAESVSQTSPCAGLIRAAERSLKAAVEVDGEIAPFQLAAEELDRVFHLLASDDLERPGVRYSHGYALFAIAERQAEPDAELVARAVEQLSGALRDAPREEHWMQSARVALMAATALRFSLTSADEDLDAAVSAGRAAIAGGVSSVDELEAVVGQVTGLSRQRYDRRHDREDLDYAIQMRRSMADDKRLGAQGRAGFAADVALDYRERHLLTGDLDDLQMAVVLADAAAGEFETGHVARPQALRAQSVVRMTWADTDGVGDLAAANVACACAEAALEAARDANISIGLYLSDCADALNVRYQYTDDVGDLDVAVARYREAIALERDDLVFKGRLHLLLGNTLLQRGKRSRAGDVADAIVEFRAAMDPSMCSDDEIGRRAAGLAAGLIERRRLTDVEAAIELLEDALERTTGDPLDVVPALCHLSLAFRARSDLTGDLHDLDRAIAKGREARAHSADQNKIAIGHALGNALLERFAFTGAREDIDEAVAVLSTVVAVSPAVHAAFVRVALSDALRKRALRFQSRQDADRAVAVAEEALSLADPMDPSVHDLWAVLGRTLIVRADLFGDPDDLDRCIDVLWRAVATIQDDAIARGPHLSAVAGALRTRFARTQHVEDINWAISLARSAVAELPPGDPSHGIYRSNLGGLLGCRYDVLKDVEDIEEVRSLYRMVALDKVATADTRAACARAWADIAAGAEDWDEAVEAYSTTLDLIEVLASRGLERDDQEYALARMSGVGVDAVASAIAAGHAERAAELFEQGRAVLLHQALETRLELAELAEQRPELAATFRELRGELDDPGSASEAAESSSESRIDRVRRTAEAFEAVVEAIRAVPGHERFLRAPAFGDLVAAAPPAPLVLVNISRLRCDALVIDGADVCMVPLPDADRAEVDRRARQLLEQVDDDTVADTQAWLWSAIVEPVLLRLGMTAPPSGGEAFARLWWCTTGLLSVLPLQAAGLAGDETASLMDRAVSSFTPSIRTLAHARRRSGLGAASASVAGVAMANTPDRLALPGAISEIDRIRDLMPKAVELLVDGDATSASVKAAMARHPWVHFACHAECEVERPSDALILLHDHQQQPLTIAELSRLALPFADFVFLSACSTGLIGVSLPDEHVALASAFQVAGFRRAVATLWPLDDDDAVRITADFYSSLVSDEDMDPALALHGALRRAKREVPRRPLVWAAHQHVGA